MITRFALSATLALTLLACKSKTEAVGQGAAPPPIASSKPGVCSSGGGTVKDKVTESFFPRTISDFCIDPNADARAFGENATGNFDQVCTELFNGECEIYKGFGLRRVVTLHYVDGRGSPGTVDIVLSRFSSPEGAFAFYTKRVVGDADPAQLTSKELAAGGAAIVGGGSASVWRFENVVELHYENELENPEQLRKSADQILPLVASAIGEALPGTKALLPAVAALPTADRIPLGVRFERDNILGVKGLGSGAIGYYRNGDTRYRLSMLARADDDGAKDVIRSLRRLPAAKNLKDQAYDMLTVPLRENPDAPQVLWVFALKGNAVWGIGEEVGEPAASNKDAEAKSLTRKIERLLALLKAAPDSKKTNK